MGQRHFLQRDGVKLSYVDFGSDASRTLVALHGRAGCARNYAPLAHALKPDWRVVGSRMNGEIGLLHQHGLHGLAIQLAIRLAARAARTAPGTPATRR